VLQDPDARFGLVQALIQQAVLMVGEAAVARQAGREALEALLDALGQGRSGGQQPEAHQGGQ
jgi:hypothetical protein